jgi:hypothetical protein
MSAIEKAVMYIKWRLAQIWALNVAFRLAFRAMLDRRSARAAMWTWRWWVTSWHAIEVGRLLGFPNCAYYGTDGYLQRRQARANRRWIKEASKSRERGGDRG